MKPGDRIWLALIRMARRKEQPVTGFEAVARAFLMRLGYTVISPTEKAIKRVQAGWVAAGIDKGE